MPHSGGMGWLARMEAASYSGTCLCEVYRTSSPSPRSSIPDVHLSVLLHCEGSGGTELGLARVGFRSMTSKELVSASRGSLVPGAPLGDEGEASDGGDSPPRALLAERDLAVV